MCSCNAYIYSIRAVAKGQTSITCYEEVMTTEIS